MQQHEQGDLCPCRKKRQNRLIFGTAKPTFTIDINLKLFSCASEKEFYPRRGPSRGQLDWDTGIWGHNDGRAVVLLPGTAIFRLVSTWYFYKKYKA